MNRTIRCICLTAAMLIMMVFACGSAFAKVIDHSEDWFYTVSGDHIVLNTYKGTETEITVPSHIEYLPVRVLNVTFQGMEDITKVTLPDTITTIGERAFSGLPLLTDVNIPSSVTSIGKEAFSYCSQLEKVTLPEGLISIGENAFYYCEALEVDSLPESLTSIGKGAFCGTNLKSVTIPGTNGTVVGDYAFSSCDSLTSVGIGEGVVSLGASSFSGAAIESVYLPESITAVGEKAFAKCELLETFESYAAADFGNNVFMSCKSLKNVDLGSAKSIGSYAFSGCSALTEITLPDTVTSIGGSAFYGCSALTDITLPDTVISIGDNTFYGCSALTDIALPANLTAIPNNMFYNCTALAELSYPAGVTQIGNYAFYGCTAYEFVTLPDGITTIGNCAFIGSENFRRKIWIPDSVTEIGSNALDYCDIFYNTGSAAASYSGMGVYQYGSNAHAYNEPEGRVIMEAGQTLDLGLIVFPFFTEYYWEFSNPSAAHFNESGELVADQRGETAITMYNSKDNKRITSLYLESVIYMTDFSFDNDLVILEYEDYEDWPYYYIEIANRIPENATETELTWEIVSGSSVSIASSNDYGCELTVNGTGETVITATDVRGLTRTCTVRVVKPSAMVVEPSEKTLTPGETVQLQVTVSDDQGNPDTSARSYTSTNPAVATVSDTGLVTAVSGGYAEIRITTETGMYGVCEIIVYVPAEDLELSCYNITLPVGMRVLAETKILPAGASNHNVYYESFNPDVVNIQNGHIVAVSPGTTTVRHYADDNPAIYKDITVTVSDELKLTDLPDDLTAIREEAFAGTSAELILLPENLSRIGSRAFANCESLKLLVISRGGLTFDGTIFNNSPDAVMTCFFDTYSHSQAQASGLPYVFLISR